MVEIQPVSGRSALRAFIGLPYALYRGHPHWVPPLRLAERERFRGILPPVVTPEFYLSGWFGFRGSGHSASAIRSTRRQARTSRSTCAAVAHRAKSSSLSSVSGVATRVMARTFE